VCECVCGVLCVLCMYVSVCVWCVYERENVCVCGLCYVCSVLYVWYVYMSV